jgi:hypothetical protein
MVKSKSDILVMLETVFWQRWNCITSKENLPSRYQQRVQVTDTKEESVWTASSNTKYKKFNHRWKRIKDLLREIYVAGAERPI